jgi:hypothetical protein
MAHHKPQFEPQPQVVKVEDDVQNGLKPHEKATLSELAGYCGILRFGKRKPRHNLKFSAQWLIRLAQSNVDFNLLDDPTLVAKRSMLPNGKFDIPESDSVFIVQDGAKGLLGNGGYWLDNKGEKLDVPSIPNSTSRDFHSWHKGYLAWMQTHGVDESNSMVTRRASQIAYNLSRVPHLAAKIPLIHVTTCLYVMERNREEIVRGEKRHMVDKLYTLQAEYGEKVEINIWSITTSRIKKAEFLEMDTSNG